MCTQGQAAANGTIGANTFVKEVSMGMEGTQDSLAMIGLIIDNW